MHSCEWSGSGAWSEMQSFIRKLFFHESLIGLIYVYIYCTDFFSKSIICSHRK